MAMPEVQRSDDAQDGFLMILPEVGRLLRWCFRDRTPEQKEELVQEALCQCWAMCARAHQRGKTLPAHGLAWYGWLATKSGRRFCWESKRSVKDWTNLETVDPDELLGVSPAWVTTHMTQAHRAWEDFISE